MELHEEFFRSLCDDAHDLIQSVAPDGKILYVNRAWLATLGYGPDQVSSLHVFDVIHPDSRAHCERVMKELLAGTPATALEADFIAKDGRRVPIEGSAICQFEQGRPVATRGIFRDVSRRKTVEAERDSLFRLSLDLLCVAGMDGFFRQVNPAFEKLLGYSRGELTQRQFLEFVHPDDREATLAAMEQLRRGFPVVDFENRYLAADGSHRWLAWRSTAPDAEGRIYAVARDVTEARRLAELMRRQTEELARINAELEQFAAAASHDLRAPLRAIDHLADWIAEELPADASPQTRDRLAQLRQRVRRMDTLIEDLLRYARAGRGHEQIQMVDTAELVKETAFLLNPPERFRITIAEGMPRFATVRAPLEQVFRNLVGNAIKHHDRPEGSVVVSSSRNGRFHEFRVEDDGPGIPREFEPRLFRMFQQAHPAAAGGAGGTGIGLALIRKIVERYGGTVRVERLEPRGLAVRFTWPEEIGSGEMEHADTASG